MNAIERTRAAAIEYLRANYRKHREDAEEIFAAIEAGRLDALSIVQTFLAFGEAERLIERERAAGVADEQAEQAAGQEQDHSKGWRSASLYIASAIREGSDQS